MILSRFPTATAVLILLAVHGHAVHWRAVHRTASAEEPVAIPDYQRDVLPILRSHCADCHGTKTQESGVRLDTLSTDVITDRAAAESWHAVLKVLTAGQMPPEEQPPLSPPEFATLTKWVSAKVSAAISSQEKTDGRVVLRRLNRTEYQNTMRDLLGMDMNYVRDLPPDAISSDGFTNSGLHLQMSAIQLEYYLETARRAMDRVIVIGEAPQVFDHEFGESKINHWLGDAEKSNLLGRHQEFLAKMNEDYPEQGDFLVRVKLTAELKSDVGFPLLEVSVGYQPDTQILLREFDLVEVSSPDEQVFEFSGRLEEFPLPVRGQGKFPGLVVRVRNRYDDGSPLPEPKKEKNKKTIYPDEPHLPKLQIQSVEFHGPFFKQWPPASHRAILFESPLRTDDEDEYAKEVLTRFMTRAFRRPVEETELQRLLDHYHDIRPEFPSFEATMRETLALVLIQPSFLYFIEPAGDEKRPITDWELASRLSYFLWSTMPDRPLMKDAADGRLKTSEVLRSEIDRMLNDSRSFRFVEQFSEQWLQLGRLKSIAVNKELHPDFDDDLKQELRNETQSFFAELLHHNLSALNLLDSDFVMLSERLARHYQFDGVLGSKMRRVPIPPNTHRGGLLGQASVLMSNSTGADSHPVRRAVWIRDRLLNDPPAPPPPDVPSLEQADPKFHQLSIREQLEIHREKASCESCHRGIDPWGIALENFDAIGRWRNERPNSAGAEGETVPINATDTLPGGVKLAGFDGLKHHLMSEHQDTFSRSLVSRLLVYALGRRLELSDEGSIDDLNAAFKADDYRLRDLVFHLVNSEPFQTK